MQRFMVLGLSSFLAATSAMAQENQFEITLSSGETLNTESEKARLKALEPDYLEVRSKDILIRVSARILEDEGPGESIEMSDRNNFLKLYREVDGVRKEIACRPNAEETEGFMKRTHSTPELIEGSFEVVFETCRGLYDEVPVTGDFLPLTVTGTYSGTPTRFD